MTPNPSELAKMLPQGCAVCGGAELIYGEVLWRALIDEWQLSPEETTYINIQQGLSCRSCGNNLRSMVLARSICRAMGHEGTLISWMGSSRGQGCRILEINIAGGLTNYLRQSPGHQLIEYPQVDIHSLPFPEHSFDLVVHSDTLEHVTNPVHALVDCRRILRPFGVLAFTVPVVVGRISRSRQGLPPSFHGSPNEEKSDYRVQTEFGVDFWTLLLHAGFDAVTIHSLIFPAGLAVTARRVT